MIRLIEDAQTLRSYPCHDVYAVRAFALLKSYDTAFPFTRYWLQEKDGVPTAFVAALDSHFTLSYLPAADLEELCAFFQMVGFATLQCDAAFLLPVSFQTGPVLQKQGALCEKLPAVMQMKTSVPLDAVYQLNQSALGNCDYKTWYADLSRRVRQKTSVAYGLFRQDEIVCTALLTALVHPHAVIGYMATLPSERRKGFASALLQQITQDESITYFILCEQNLKSFYEKSGFCMIGNWRMYQNDTLF